MSASVLWTEKYRPQTVDEYVFRDEQQRIQVLNWIESGSLPSLILTGVSGTGKSSLALLLCKAINVHELDKLMLNASRNNSIDDVRDKITNFIQMMPFGNFKVVILDEFDYASVQMQAALRGLIEEYHDTARFIFTANFKNRILPAIHSRCQGFHIERLDETEYTAKMAEILLNENIEFDLDILDTFVKTAYPDMRKCINLLQMSSIDGKLFLPNQDDKTNTNDYQLEMVELFKKGKIAQARKLLCSKARPEEIEGIYRWCYDNIELFGDTEQKQEQAILIIKQGLVDHTICADAEINLAAVMIKLARNCES